MTDSTRRAIPSVEAAVQAIGGGDLPRPLVVALVRRELEAIRQGGDIPAREEIFRRLERAVERMRRTRLQRVINATGIPLHTNFGRAPLSPEAVALIAEVASGYSNLEYDLAEGARGSRGAYVEECLALLCEAEAGTVVNNCAAALVLILKCFTRTRREVIVSRGELVQIGGGFRIPEILEASGARLREVGTTNRTTAEDYRRALGSETALLLKVHRSNFEMTGFVEAASEAELAELARAAGVSLVHDLGSGAVLNFSPRPGAPREPTPAEALRAGADLVCFSGDKLFGGPQAGIIAGRGEYIRALKGDPLFRALRCDKLSFAALQVTVEQYLAGVGLERVPAWALLRADPAGLRSRAEAIVEALRESAVEAGVVATEAEVGGGTMPRARIPSVAVALENGKGGVAALAARLRAATPAVIGYIADDRLLLDLRTVAPADDPLIIASIREISAQ
jgi:L-seryl-tRNA(Ser) seleniumtransferase